jgi:TPR repeat protein
MNITCSGSYVKDQEALNLIYEKYGYTSPSAERELICLAHTGNTAALKSYADLLFYHKIKCRGNYKKAFPLYCSAADVVFEECSGKCGGGGDPHAYFPIGYYLTNYKKESVLKFCDTIDEIENIDPDDRLSMALDFALASLDYCKSPAAINLIGRIVGEKPELMDRLEGNTSAKDCFEEAAEGGYVYACNNLAAKEADLIVNGVDDVDAHINSFIHYLTISADRLEPYAANRLGLFYMIGEVRSSDGRKQYFRDYINVSFAKKYFQKATVYPDSNSAWAYFNLIKYFHKDYDTNLDLLNEHMDCIKELNPAVYNEAIEL